MKNLRFLVIGVGRMGTNHVRVLSEMPNVSLVGVCDKDRENAVKLSRRFQVEHAYSSLEEAVELPDVEAAVIALPTSEHLKAAEICMARGINLLVEKPMASTIAECDRMLDLARGSKVHLMVGHIERFNPVILKLREFLAEGFLGSIYYVETVRSGPFPKRLYGSKDGVVIDLAVHDLDLVSYLFGGLTQVYANHITAENSKQEIHSRVMFKTRNGISGSSQFSWISPRRERSMMLYGDKGILQCDLMDQEIWYYENGDVEIDFSDNYFQNVLLGRVSEGKVVKFPIKKEEPLRSELGFFCSLIRDGTPHDPVYGRAAVQYSVAMLQSAREDRIVRITE